MTKLLSEEKIKELAYQNADVDTDRRGRETFSFDSHGLVRIARAIEAAVLEAQGKQEPWPFSADRVTYHKAAPVVQPGYKLLKDTTHDERSWPEDSSHENGAYFCLCHHCGRQFTGHKRRVTCKVCAEVIAAAEGKE